MVLARHVLISPRAGGAVKGPRASSVFEAARAKNQGTRDLHVP
jgi:hypothetical protein